MARAVDIKCERTGAIMATALLNGALTISDSVQGVTEWAVERRIDTGGGYSSYTTIDPYTCPSSPLDETEAYVFAFRDDINQPTFEIGYKVQYRFTPTGYDTGNGDAWESAEYVVAKSSISSQGGNSIDCGVHI